MTKYFPLKGIKVIALEQYISGPYCSMWLADAGAEVIKIERPDTGEPRRNYMPVIKDEDGNEAYGGFISYNRNKKSLVLDVKTEEGKKIYKELIKEADVVIENMKPGTVEKLGIDYEVLKEINPKLIYAAISGFGRDKDNPGVYSDRPAFDPVIQAMGGIMHLIGEAHNPPMWGFYGLADLYTGTVTVNQILLALFMRERTGEGQFIDSSMYDNMVSLNERAIMLYSFTGEVAIRGKENFQAPAGVYRTADDGYVALIVANDMIWKRFCAAINREDLIDNPKTKTGTARAANKDFLNPLVENWILGRTRDEIVSIFNKQGVPVGPIQTSEDLINCPQLKTRNMLIDVNDPVAGKLVLARTPLSLSKAESVPACSAPRLGEHTEMILKDVLKYDDEKISELYKNKVIQSQKTFTRIK